MKQVLVTGANKGIGYAIVEGILKDYPDVVVFLGSRDASRGQTAVDTLKSALNVGDDRLRLLVIETSSKESVTKAAAQVEGPLYGIVNNAGIGWNSAAKDILQTNYHGVKYVTEAFLPKMEKGGRIVMTSSAAGPMFVADHCKDGEVKDRLAKPWTLAGMEELDSIATSYPIEEGFPAYGFSKALLNAYTYQLAQAHPELFINAQTPGYIKTDLTTAMGANPSKTPQDGAVPAIHLLFDEGVTKNKQGWYYGSDCKLSPIDKYRDPGTPEFEGPFGPE